MIRVLIENVPEFNDNLTRQLCKISFIYSRYIKI